MLPPVSQGLLSNLGVPQRRPAQRGTVGSIRGGFSSARWWAHRTIGLRRRVCRGLQGVFDRLGLGDLFGGGPDVTRATRAHHSRR